MADISYKRIVLIDDDPLCILTNKILWREILPETVIDVFTDPSEGLAYLLALNEGDDKCIVLLDINMPDLSGWDILDKIKETATLIQHQCKIYILSSSLDPKDKHIAATYSIVSGFFEKPLTRLNLQGIVNNL